jgi:hydroxyacylglutathione hydrolase
VAGLHVITIETPSLGDRSYIVHDGTDALVIDPQRDIDRVLRELEELGLRC